MKRTLWIGGGVVGAIVIVVAVAAVWLFSNIDSLVKTAVERVGSDVTKVKVTLDKADVEVTSGKAALSGLTVGNPPGFKGPYAFALGQVSVALDTASIGQDPIVLKEVRITQPRVNYEITPQGQRNIDTIRKNVEGPGGATPAGPGGPPAGGGQPGGGTASKPADQGPKLVIENLYITGGEVAVSSDLLGSRQMGAALPAIHLKDIGKGRGGATAEQVAEQVIAALTQSTGRAVAGLNLDALLKDPAKALEGAKGAVEDAKKQLEGGGLRGLIGR
jgi:hypothetical protein